MENGQFVTNWKAVMGVHDSYWVLFHNFSQYKQSRVENRRGGEEELTVIARGPRGNMMFRRAIRGG
jgi:hypothetical protein